MSSRSLYPGFFGVRQQITADPIDDVAAAVRDSLNHSSLADQLAPGQSVAIAVGSRGIADLRQIVRAVVDWTNAQSAQPWIVPAMGSHGGATAEGQAKLLASLGIDDSIGCPIRASMETTILGQADGGVDIHFDTLARGADHVIVVNRVKPHTRLTGRYESGLIKMLMIGLGNHRGASLYHQIFGRHHYQLNELAKQIVPVIIAQTPVSLGLAIVEDAMENVSLIEAVNPPEFLHHEPKLLATARAKMPRLPFDQADLLIVDTIGKEFSGTGMDTNVIGRKASDKQAGPEETPKIHEIYVRSLSAKTNGNASGIGIAEYCHRHVVEAIDHEATRINCITAAHASAGAIPLTFECDRDVFDAVLSQVGPEHAPDQKWMWISDTLHLAQLACSEAFWQEVSARDDLQATTDIQQLKFDEAGNLLAFE